MNTASHRYRTLQATLIEFEQLLQGRKWELFSHCKATLLISVTVINQSVLRSTIKASVKYEDSQHFVSRNLQTVGRLLQFTKLEL